MFGLWLFWSVAVHYAWLSRWYLYPITAILLLPSLFWLMNQVMQEAYDETLEGIKIFYEMLAAQIGCGLSLVSAIVEVIDCINREQRMVASLKEPLNQLALEVKIGLFSVESLKPLTVLSKVALMEKCNSQLEIGMKTGSNIDDLLIQFADLLSDLLRNKSEFKRRLSQKRSEFHIMMVMPIGATIGIRGMLPEYFSVLYETMRGMFMLLVITAIYSASCHMFYNNANQILSEEG